MARRLKTLVRSWSRAALRRAGLRIERREGLDDLMRRPPSPTRGLVLEFFGPTGVGKSTIFAHWHARRSGEWFLSGHACRIPRGAPDEPRIEEIARRIFFDKLGANGGHAEVAAWDAIRRTEYRAKILLQDLRVRSGALPRGFALDEGLFQIFGPQICALPEEDLDCLLGGRALVYVRPSEPATVLERSLGRDGDPWRAARRGGGGQPADWRLRQAEAACAMFDRLLARLSGRAVPLVILDAEADLRENAGKVLGFEREILARNLQAEGAPAG